MKSLRLLMLLACFGIFFSLLSSAVFALESDEARASIAWSTESPYKGSTTSVNVLFINDSPYQLTIHFFGLHFDWMEDDKFTGHNLSEDPVVVSGYGTASLPAIIVQIPDDVTLGSHSYYLGIDGVDENSEDFSWDSSTLTVIVQTSALDVYNNLETQVEARISDANYQSPEAKSFLEDAEFAFSQAQTYAGRNNYDQAINFLESASFNLDQAETAEQSYVPTQSDQDLLLLVVAAVAFVVVVVVVIMLTRKGEQTPETKPPTDL